VKNPSSAGTCYRQTTGDNKHHPQYVSSACRLDWHHHSLERASTSCQVVNEWPSTGVTTVSHRHCRHPSQVSHRHCRHTHHRCCAATAVTPITVLHRSGGHTHHSVTPQRRSHPSQGENPPAVCACAHVMHARLKHAQVHAACQGAHGTFEKPRYAPGPAVRRHDATGRPE